MATAIMPPTFDEELSPEEIDRLLAEATDRLQSKAVTAPSSSFRIPRFDTGSSKEERRSIVKNGSTVKVKGPAEDGQVTVLGVRKVEDPIASKASAKEKKNATAGSMWFDLPKTNMTPELKRDLQLIKMRGVLDPHRHYKKDNGKMQAPEYSMVGTITEGATEFYSGRIENKKRKQTFVEEVLAAEQDNGRFKRKYGEIQAKKSSGKKAFYKSVQAKRFKGVKKGG